LAADQLTVRLAAAPDHDRVLELVKKLDHVFDVDPKKFSETFEFVLGDGDRTMVYVAEQGGDIVGYCLTTVTPLLYSNGPSAQLQEIVVDEDKRVSGVGTALVRAVEEACERMGVKQLTVASRRAGGFYDRLGYSQQAEYMRRLF
jgi:N-acetylglutamate synthase-like GNAT family acetyltransferase